MIDLKRIEELASRIEGLLPPGSGAVRDELRNNIKTVLEAAFARMDLVTREEFDAQAALLKRTREKLDALEAEINTLEPPA